MVRERVRVGVSFGSGPGSRSGSGSGPGPGPGSGPGPGPGAERVRPGKPVHCAGSAARLPQDLSTCGHTSPRGCGTPFCLQPLGAGRNRMHLGCNRTALWPSLQLYGVEAATMCGQAATLWGQAATLCIQAAALSAFGRAASHHASHLRRSVADVDLAAPGVHGRFTCSNAHAVQMGCTCSIDAHASTGRADAGGAHAVY